MELLLNLVWLLLAVSAFWLWRNELPFEAKRRMLPARGVLILASALMLLFPVISATDDMHAMRPELEESTSGKRVLSDGGSERSRFANSHVPVLVWNPSVLFARADHVFGWIVVDGACSKVSVLLTSRPGRAPPSFLLT